jgi:phage portal protein BeeE
VPVGQSQTYANLNDEALSLERFTLSGFVDPIQDAISELLPGEREMQIDMTALTRAGQESRFRSWQIATGGKAWMDVAEVRALEGLPPNPDLEESPEPAAPESPEAPAEAPSDEETEEAAPEATPAGSGA